MLALVASALLAASTFWFFAARDNRGRTARLTADAWYYHAYLPSLVFDQDLDFRDEFAITKNWYRLGETPTGRQANVFGIGPAIYELPFFVAGHGVASLSSGRADGFSNWEVEATLYASLLFSLGALFFAARLLNRRFSGRYGPIAVAVLVAAGGPVVYYAIRQPGYAHPFATFWVAWLVDHWDASFQGQTAPRSRRFWIAMGLLIGAASLARPQLVLWSLLGGYAAVSDLTRLRAGGLDRREVLRQVSYWLLGAACALVVVLPQLLAWKALYGQFAASPQGDGFMRWGDSAWLETLMSSRNGLFPWAPIYAIASLGLLVGLWRHRRLCSMLLLGLLLQAYVNGAAWDWWAGGSFGGRRFDSCFIAVTFGLGVLLLGPWREGFHFRGRRPQKLAGMYLAGLCVLLAVANLRFASTQSAHTVRIYGGEPARKILWRKSGMLGATSAWASSLANVPVRAAFAWQHDVGLAAYDRIVGVHQLGELFPGLNSIKDKKRDKLDLNPERPGVVGLVRTPKGFAAPTGRFSVLFGLNRLGPVELHIRLVEAGTVVPTIQLNGGVIEALQHATAKNVYIRSCRRIAEAPIASMSALNRASRFNPWSLWHAAAQPRGREL